MCLRYFISGGFLFMNRGTFLKSVLAAAIAPKSIVKELAKPKVLYGTPGPELIYSHTEMKLVSRYIAGYAKFSEQMLRNLPYLQAELPKILLKDFK